MSTKAGGTDHLFLFTYGNWLLITCAFRFNIHYLFVYLFKAMSTKAGGKRPPVFIYLWKSLFVRHGFRLNIQYLFIYLFKAMSTKAGGTHDLYLLMEITCCETWFSFEYSLSIYLFIQSDVNKNRWN